MCIRVSIIFVCSVALVAAVLNASSEVDDAIAELLKLEQKCSELLENADMEAFECVEEYQKQQSLLKTQILSGESVVLNSEPVQINSESASEVLEQATLPPTEQSRELQVDEVVSAQERPVVSTETKLPQADTPKASGSVATHPVVSGVLAMIALCCWVL